MIEVYNSLLELSHERLEDLTAAAEPAARMPRRDEIVDAMSRMMLDRYAIPNPVSDPVLRRCLLRILQVNRLVLADATAPRRSVALVGAGDIEEAPAAAVEWLGRTISGEMACPECGHGSLCYLIGREGGAFVECSTVNCLYWDSRR